MPTWIKPTAIFAVPSLVATGGFWLFGCETIREHHVFITSLIGLVVVLPLLLWRTLVASDQLRQSMRIADGATKSRSDDILVNGAKMIGATSPESRWIGINILIRLVEEQPAEYMESVVLAFCEFLRQRGHPATDQQKQRIFERISEWLKADEWNDGTPLNLQGLNVTGILLEGIALNANLRSANVQNSAIDSVDFSGSNFSMDQNHIFTCHFSLMRDCNFDHANMANAEFRNVDFRGSTFHSANISSMHLIEQEPDSPATGMVITMRQLAKAYWSEGTPPRFDGVVDAETGEPVTLEGIIETRERENSPPTHPPV